MFPKQLILKELSRYRLGTYADIIYRNALLYPDQEAFIYGSERITFYEFNQRVNSLIHALQSMGLKKGDVIGILSWNCLEYTDVFGAAMKGGFIASPFNPRLKADELYYLINYSEANILFVGSELVEMVDLLKPRLKKVKIFISFEALVPNMIAHNDLLTNYSSAEPDVEVVRDDPLYIFYTSGTTGTPRGALYTQHQKMQDTRIYAQALGVEIGDKHVMIMPLFHIGGHAQFWTFFYAGGSNVILKFFDPVATLKIIQEERATDIHIVPTHLVAMFALPDFDNYDLSSLKRIWYAASPMPVELLKKAIKKFGPILIQGYGQTESGPLVALLPKWAHKVLEKPSDGQEILSSCGQPCIGTHIRIVDDKGNDVKPGEVGEIIVQGEQIMTGYWRKPDETKETIIDGWLHTGDLGRYDERGYIYIVDRKRDMIISGGENIYPREVEEILYQHPSVKEVAVIGIPDPYWVERVHAVIVLREGETVTSEEIIEFCKQRIARYKAPKSVEFVDSLPKTPSGKILKRELRERYWKGERKI
jgi:acyl-CoA synthetase (AMP-forming)/AMP-acid ligase II